MCNEFQNKVTRFGITIMTFQFTFNPCLIEIIHISHHSPKLKKYLFIFAERSGSKYGRVLAFVVVAVVVGAALAGYIFYKYRLRVSLS